MSNLASVSDEGTNHTRPSFERGLDPLIESRSRIRADRDWQRFATSRRGAAALDQWRSTCPHLGRHQSLDEVVLAMRGESREMSNHYWAELLHLARQGVDLARRVMIQVLVPFLERETTRWDQIFTNARHRQTRAEIEQLVYFAVVQSLQRLEARDTPISWPVLDVVRETRRIVTGAIRTDERWSELTLSLDDQASAHSTDDDSDHNTQAVTLVLEDEDQVPPAEGLHSVLAELVRAGRISESNASLVWQTRCGIRSFDELAQERCTTADTLRRRRHRAEQSLFGAMADAA